MRGEEGILHSWICVQSDVITAGVGALEGRHFVRSGKGALKSKLYATDIDCVGKGYLS